MPSPAAPSGAPNTRIRPTLFRLRWKIWGIALPPPTAKGGSMVQEEGVDALVTEQDHAQVERRQTGPAQGEVDAVLDGASPEQVGRESEDDAGGAERHGERIPPEHRQREEREAERRAGDAAEDDGQFLGGRGRVVRRRGGRIGHEFRLVYPVFGSGDCRGRRRGVPAGRWPVGSAPPSGGGSVPSVL